MRNDTIPSGPRRNWHAAWSQTRMVAQQLNGPAGHRIYYIAAWRAYQARLPEPSLATIILNERQQAEGRPLSE